MTSLRASVVRQALHLQRGANLPMEQMRARAEKARFPLPRHTRIEPIRLGQADTEWITAPGAHPDRVILYLHGGGYVQRSPGVHRALCARLSAAAGMRTLMVDYRLAPEHPFPAALDDTLSAYRDLLDSGIGPTQIAFSGDSAGGGLLLTALICLRDGGEPLPAAGVCISPWTDVTLSQGSALEDHDPTLRRDSLLNTVTGYTAGRDPYDPLISPVYGDLHGLPPLLIQAGAIELLRDDAVRLAERARAAGVPTQLEIAEGMWHCWSIYPAFLVPEARPALQRIGAFLRKVIKA